eukprot:10907118-Ditylum_brightwellii.AAC.1
MKQISPQRKTSKVEQKYKKDAEKTRHVVGILRKPRHATALVPPHLQDDDNDDDDEEEEPL